MNWKCHSLFIASLIYAYAAFSQTVSTMPDKEQLTIALDYFSGGKYREALNILAKLDKKYKLNPRFKAYIGICYYYNWEYNMACKYLDPYLNELEVYAPHERSVYFFADAESHFILEEYRMAVPAYERALNVCYDKEKGDMYFKMGYCYMQFGKWENAMENLNSALAYYEQFGYPENKTARVIQIRKMIRGCEEELRKIPVNSLPK